MRIYLVLFFLGLVGLTACKHRSVPPGIIPEDRMVKLLVQVHLADGTLYTMPQIPDTLYLHGMGRYLMLFKDFHTDSTQFKKSFRYYSSKPELITEMYDEIVKEMQSKSDSLNKLHKTHP